MSGENLFRPALASLVAYEPGKPVEEVQRELGLKRVVKLASNEGQFEPFPAALEAIQRGAREHERPRRATLSWAPWCTPWVRVHRDPVDRGPDSRPETAHDRHTQVSHTRAFVR